MSFVIAHAMQCYKSWRHTIETFLFRFVRGFDWRIKSIKSERCTEESDESNTKPCIFFWLKPNLKEIKCLLRRNKYPKQRTIESYQKLLVLIVFYLKIRLHPKIRSNLSKSLHPSEQWTFIVGAMSSATANVYKQMKNKQFKLKKCMQFYEDKCSKCQGRKNFPNYLPCACGWQGSCHMTYDCTVKIARVLLSHEMQCVIVFNVCTVQLRL